MQFNRSISKPTVYLCTTLFLMQTAYGFGIAQTGGHSTNLNTWHALALYWAMGWWFVNDSQEYGVKWNDNYIDMGLFLYLAWVFILPYYLFKSRGRKAFYTMLLILGIYFGASILGAITYLLVRA
jgi:hypothetical protein